MRTASFELGGPKHGPTFATAPEFVKHALTPERPGAGVPGCGVGMPPPVPTVAHPTIENFPIWPSSLVALAIQTCQYAFGTRQSWVGAVALRTLPVPVIGAVTSAGTPF